MHCRSNKHYQCYVHWSHVEEACTFSNQVHQHSCILKPCITISQAIQSIIPTAHFYCSIVLFILYHIQVSWPDYSNANHRSPEVQKPALQACHVCALPVCITLSFIILLSSSALIIPLMYYNTLIWLILWYALTYTLTYCMSQLHSTYDSNPPWLFLYYIRLWMHVLISPWNVYCLSSSQAWVRFSSELSERLNTSHWFRASTFCIWIILSSLLVFQNSFGVISKPSHPVGRLLTPSDFLDFPHRRGSWHQVTVIMDRVMHRYG